ncbi:MAG TPA: hypothetical protein VD858_15405, partial [Reyranella sp.]|nr:hypothetical protein [Reyranella sp.]
TSGAGTGGGAAGTGGAAGMMDSGGAGGMVAAGTGGMAAGGAGGMGAAGGGGAAGMEALDYPEPRGGCPELDSGFVGDDACIAPPAADEGFQIHIGPEDYANPGPYEVAINEENSLCVSFRLPNTENKFYQGSIVSGRPGTHHIINTMYVAGTTINENTFEACLDPGTGTNPSILANLPGASKPFMPRKKMAPENEGLGSEIPAMAPAQADMHYYNFTEAPLLREVWMNFYYIDAAKVTETARQIRGMGGLGWAITPGTDHVYQYTCPIPSAGRIVGLLGHYHAHGKRFSAYLEKADGSQKKVFEMYDYNEPAEFMYDSAAMNPAFAANKAGAVSGTLEVAAGDILQWECHIINDSDVTLDYSNKVKNGEMCNLWGTTVLSGTDKMDCVHFLLEAPFVVQGN